MRLITRCARTSQVKRENALKALVEAGRGVGDTPPRTRFCSSLSMALTLHKRVLHTADANSEVCPGQDFSVTSCLPLCCGASSSRFTVGESLRGYQGIWSLVSASKKLSGQAKSELALDGSLFTSPRSGPSRIPLYQTPPLDLSHEAISLDIVGNRTPLKYIERNLLSEVALTQLTIQGWQSLFECH